MLPRVTIGRAGLFVAVAVGLCLVACSSSDGRRDINYGTDVAVGFVPPDGAVAIADAAPDVLREAADAPADGTQAGSDAAEAVDGTAPLDASVDESD